MDRIYAKKHHSLLPYAATRQPALPMRSSGHMSDNDWDEDNEKEWENEDQAALDQMEVSYDRLESKGYIVETLLRRDSFHVVQRHELKIWTMTRKFWLEVEERVKAKGRAIQAAHKHLFKTSEAYFGETWLEPAKIWVLVPVKPLLVSLCFSP